MYPLMRRRMMMMESGGTPPQPLPYDSKVEYLIGDGDAYIDTGVYLDQSSYVRIDFSVTTINVGRSLFGARNAYTTKDFSWSLKSADNKVRRVYGTKTQESSGGLTDPSVRYNYKQDGRVLYNSNDGVIATFSSQKFTCEYPTYLFAMNNAGTAMNVAEVKIYYAKFIGDKTLDLIPVRVGTVGYMYDQISGTLFGNVGSGAFTLGPDTN